MAKKCSKCLEVANDDAVFCSKCGSQTFVQESNESNDNDNKNEEVVELNLGQIKEETDNGVGFDTPEKEHSIVTEDEINTQISNSSVVSEKTANEEQVNEDVKTEVAEKVEEKEVVKEEKPVVQSANPQPSPLFEVRNPQYDGPSSQYVPTSPFNNIDTVKPKKKKKKNVTVLVTIFGIIGVILLVLSLTLFLLLFLAGDDDSAYNPASTFTEKNSISIGNEINGYIRVPNSWKKLDTGTQDSSIVYTDSLENSLWYIVSGVADSGTTNPQEWANSTYTNLVSQGVLEAGIDREVVNNYETYKVVCFKPNVGRYLASWYFNTSDGRTHYIAVEGPDAINDFYNMIYTYREKN